MFLAHIFFKAILLNKPFTKSLLTKPLGLETIQSYLITTLILKAYNF